MIVDKKIYTVDRHWRPQSYQCHLYDLINYYDYIILYDKHRFVNNIEYILFEIGNNYEKYGLGIKSNESTSDVNETIETKIASIDKRFNTNWGKYGNQSLFDKSLNVHAWATSNDQEMNLLNRYYTRKLAMKAFAVYSIDYMFLPLEPPLWIMKLDL